MRRAVKGKLSICLKNKYATQSHPPHYPIFAQNIKANISWIFNLCSPKNCFINYLKQWRGNRRRDHVTHEVRLTAASRRKFRFRWPDGVPTRTGSTWRKSLGPAEERFSVSRVGAVVGVVQTTCSGKSSCRPCRWRRSVYKKWRIVETWG